MIIRILHNSGSFYFRNFNRFFLMASFFAVFQSIVLIYLTDSQFLATPQILEQRIQFEAHSEKSELLFFLSTSVETSCLFFFTILLTKRFSNDRYTMSFFSNEIRLWQLLKITVILSLSVVILYSIESITDNTTVQLLAIISSTLPFAFYLLQNLPFCTLVMKFLIILCSLCIVCLFILTPHFIILENRSIKDSIKNSLYYTSPKVPQLFGLCCLLAISALLIFFSLIILITATPLTWIMTVSFDTHQILEQNYNENQIIKIPKLRALIIYTIVQLPSLLLIFIPMTVISYFTFLHLTESGTSSENIENAHH